VKFSRSQVKSGRGIASGPKPDRRRIPTPTYVVESYWPEMTEELVRSTFRRIAAASAVAQPLGCILMPSDGMVIFLFRAPSEAFVKDQSWLSEVPFDRIVESIQIGLDQQPS
jgi:hypothetical protein